MNSLRFFAGKSLRVTSTSGVSAISATGAKSFDGVVERLLVERLVVRVGADRAEHERVAVGRGLGDAVRAGHAAGAADVLDHHLLAEDFGQPRRQHAAEHVDRAAGGERHHHGHRPVGAVLRRGGGGERNQMQTSNAAT